MSSKWYIAAMNDCVFIIDRQPRPAPVDYISPTLPMPNVVISMQSGSREAQEMAKQIVAAHNADIQSQHRHSASCGHFNSEYEL